ncbi:hypothetical protein L6R29_08780 [Myxococcota bacterium]|nr:hypothetical protein [Myxococcota bacterium]
MKKMRWKKHLCACLVGSLYSLYSLYLLYLLYSLLEDPFLCIRCEPKTTRSKTTVHSAIQTTSRDRTSVSGEPLKSSEEKPQDQTTQTRAV